jgi:hypothetical protein
MVEFINFSWLTDIARSGRETVVPSAVRGNHPQVQSKNIRRDSLLVTGTVLVQGQKLFRFEPLRVPFILQWELQITPETSPDISSRMDMPQRLTQNLLGKSPITDAILNEHKPSIDLSDSSNWHAKTH